jgi:hypothetical protein
MRWHFCNSHLIAKSLHSPANLHFASMILAVWRLPSGYIYELSSSLTKLPRRQWITLLCPGEIMDREMMGQVLAELIPGDSAEIDEATLGMLFPPGEAEGVIDQRTRTEVTGFARDHGCRFLFDGQSSKSTFKTAKPMARIDRPSLHGLGQGNARHRKLPNQHRS